MPTYTPKIDEMMFTLSALAGYDGAAVDMGMVEAILSEASKLASDVLAPINWDGDQHGAVLKDGVVTTAPGFRDAYAAYRDGGWNAVPFSPDFGGQGLPWAVAFPVQEMWQAANMSFGLCPLLNQGAVEAILSHGSDDQKARFLPKLISGEWTGTMNLTEPAAGSDLGALRTRADKQADGSYKITGQKIFITYGDHDMADNIIHLVLARVAGAPDGPKGISLFIVPKVMADGTRNDVICAGLEHKMGIHASPTCTMVFGEKGGAISELIGAENDGLKYMFTMMNNARLSVGLQGVAIAERALQAGSAYAHERVQGKSVSGESGPIIIHPDVMRMILTCKAYTVAARAMTYEAAVMLDRAHNGDAAARERVDLMTPIVKSFGTDIAQTVTSLVVQIHGGMGFVEETGVAQYMRDARILPIYEGTNGIQAMDLMFRKVIKNGGASVTAWLDDARKRAPGLEPYFRLVDMATARIVSYAPDKLDAAAAFGLPYQQLMGIVMGGVMMSVAATHTDTPDTMRAAAKFYLDQIMPLAQGYHAQVMGDAATIIGA